MPQKINNNLIIESAGANIKIESDNLEILRSVERDPFLDEYIPNCEIVKNHLKKIDCGIIINKSKIFKIRLLYPIVYCFQPKMVDVKGLIALIGYLLERARNEKDIYSIHSSVIAKKGKAVIIFGGATNLGKTITAKMAADKFGWLFYADEIALIDSLKNKIIGGVKIAVNCDKFKSFQLPNTNEEPRLTAFVHPHIDNGLNQIKKWNRNKFFWHLKEELARKIRGGSKAINFFSYPLGSLDTFIIAKKRLEFAKKIASGVPCYEM